MIIYLMIHVPFVWWVKIGFAQDSPMKRAMALDKAVFGMFVPVCFVAVPFAFRIEQWFHRTFRPLHFRFYRGDGSTEVYWLPAAVPALAFMLPVWIVYLWCVGMAIKAGFGDDGLSWYCDFLRAMWDNIVLAFKFVKSILK